MPKIKMPARSFYDRTHDVKGDIDMGKMYPVLHEEVIPGDTFSLTSEMLIRMNPMIRPVMHEMNAYLRVFFVRNWTIHFNKSRIVPRRQKIQNNKMQDKTNIFNPSV